MGPPGTGSAVNGQERAGNVLSARGTEIKHSFGDLIRLATPSPGNRLDERGAKLIVHPWSTLGSLGKLNHSRRDRIDVDPMFGQFHCKHPCEHHDARLRRAVSGRTQASIAMAMDETVTIRPR